MLVPMKKATLFALKPDKDAILLELQKCGEFMAIEPDSAETIVEEAGPSAIKTLSSIKFVDAYGKKKSFLAARPVISFEEFIKERTDAQKVNEQVQSLAQKLALVKSEVSAKRALRAQLMPWKELQVPIDVQPTKYARFVAGTIDPAKEGALSSESLREADVQLLGIGSEGRAVFVTYHVSVEQEILEALTAVGFAQAVLPRVKGTAKHAIDMLTREADALEENIVNIEVEFARLTERSGELKEYYDSLVAQSERNNTKVEQTQATFCMQGWVREDMQDTVKKAVASATNDYDISFKDPKEGEIPPSYTKNNRVVTPFEVVTGLYSLPAYGAFDPNSVMAPFYAIFFGMMIGDAGYGLVLALALFFYIKLTKPRGNGKKLMGVLFIGGLSSILSGFFFGSVFGAQVPTGVIYPMKNTLVFLILTCALGVVQLFVGLIIKMKLDIKRGDFIGAIADNLSWIFIISGLIMLAFKPIKNIGIVLAGLGALAVLLFAGREKKNPIARLISGLGSLYGVTGYMSDIISYTRIAALGMSSGVIASVINMMALMVASSGSVIGYIFMVIILVAGHSFNLAIGLLGAFVHTSRLQFVEFFGKFYETGGRAFVPLSFKTKYVDIFRE